MRKAKPDNIKKLRRANVVDVCDRIAAARDRRVAASRANFQALTAQFPDDVLLALLKAVRDNRPDTLMQLSSPWRERLLAAWRPMPEEPPALVVSFPSPGHKGAVK